jgi:hypothetical protein
MPRTTSSPAPAPQRESERPATDPERTEETETPKKSLRQTSAISAPSCK